MARTPRARPPRGRPDRPLSCRARRAAPAACALAALIAAGPARALRPEPDARAALDEALAARVEALAGRDPAAAVAFARQIDGQVGALPAVRYELALTLNRQGELRAAREACDGVLELQPDHAAALYDRGELALLLGDRAAARADLTRAAALRPRHWAVHYRLALLAAEDGDPTALEAALVMALRHGMDLRLLLDDPAWAPALSDPRAGPALRRVIVVYGAESLIRELEDRSR